MKFEVTILGSSSATPIFNRNPTAQVLNINEKLYLVDCAEGTQQQMLRFDVKASRIDYIFISHLHGDHYLGLVGLLSSMHLNGRKKELKLFCPAPLKEIIDLQLKYSETTLNYPIEYVFTDATQKGIILENQDVFVETIPLDHRIPCTGFLFRQKKRLRKLIKEKIENLDVPVSEYSYLKKGGDYTAPNGTIYKNETLTTSPQEPKSYAYVSDTLYTEKYLQQINSATLLYHEATFLHDMLDRANQTHHTTALQAGEVAVRVNAEKLVIGHFSARYKTLNELLDEAQSAFPNTELAVEGKTFVISE
ncbi:MULTISPECIES: ribonuclease Z [unclassified Mucilaginibacter]|uniref:ribonuclease Z n=1 Tax=unclassified Mucilaginibacter TaxID=2617802 RepID=UPI002AC91CDC|nr:MULTISPECIES: ribonuclease Z [unclassified Mucilaginibacter]MEB0261848.1 ribonuclease Z [Mucilaginibacter sp. 10I4]MEB0278931.1 ribonuclease Z [Mucilaginibacter sp. 10B2]MEB0302508.1 ribonuclease Z [Mucilaginibacter sp. 5C4]WPX22112.1 ribonuclease Z [Mucilaginibacter sp. 5C4]